MRSPLDATSEASMPNFRILQTKALLPAQYHSWSECDRVWTCNPSITEGPNEDWILAYRLIGPDLRRRIALCRLGPDLSPEEGSHVAFSDLVQFPSGSAYPEQVFRWFADPRLFDIGTRLFLYWNSGWHEPQNHQFIHEVDRRTLRPLGRPREILLPGLRQKIEKNWTFFGTDRTLAIYSPSPHKLLVPDFAGDGPVLCAPLSETAWDDYGYSAQFGALRGGATPRKLGNHYYSFCHSIQGTEGNYRYLPAVYRFSAEAGFRPTDAPTAPLPIPNPFGNRRRLEPLNPAIAQVLYPFGAVPRQGNWYVSYGINDETCALCILPYALVDSHLRKLPPSAQADAD